MQITKVIDQGESYLVNDLMSVPKSEGNTDYKNIQSWIDQGNSPSTKSNEDLLKEAKSSRLSTRRAYLASTDWYITREADSPNSYPIEIKNKRIQARTEINAIESATTLAEVEVYNEIFE